MSDDKSNAAEARAAQVRALEEERRGYVQRGLKDRVSQVDEQIRLAKGEVKERSTGKRETAAPPKSED